MSNRMVPPANAERLLRRAIRDADWRDAVLGDLREEFGAALRARGRAAARSWYWRQSLRLSGRFAVGRLLRRPAGARPWVGSADFDEAGGWRRGWLRDVRHAWRSIVRRPTLAAVIAGTLALALAANATIFSIMDALVLRPYRFAGVERLVLVASDSPSAPIYDRESVSPFDFREWQRQAKSVQGLAAWDWWNANLSEVDTPELVPAFKVSGAFFRTLSVQAARGRMLDESDQESGNTRRVVIGQTLWARRFASDPAIIGRTIRLDGEAYEVVGITPPGFNIPWGSEVWAPFDFTPEQWNDHRPGALTVIGQLAPGATPAAVHAEFTGIVQRQRSEHPDTHAKREVRAAAFTDGMADPGAGPFLSIWQAASVLLLLIACANIANLLLARGAERASEFGVRLAMGAGRGRLAWQMFLEGAVLSLLAALLSIPLTLAGLSISRGGIPTSVLRFVPGWQFLSIDLRILLVTAVLGAAATILFALAPAFSAMRSGASDALRQSTRTTTASRRRHWGRSVLAGAQVALTLALLFGSGLMLSAADQAVNGALGFDKRNVMTAQLALQERPYKEAEARRRFIDRVTERIQTVPAVRAAAVTSSLPYGASNQSRPVFPEGEVVQPQDALFSNYRRVTPTLFTTLGIPMLAGRGFTGADREGSPDVAIVSRLFAERHWPGADPIGRRFRTSPDGPWLTVVGVSDDLMHNWFLGQRRPTFYRPVAQDAGLEVTFVVRTVGDPLAVSGDLRRAIFAADPSQPIAVLASLEQVVADRTGGLTFIAKALTLVALIAFTLAMAGVYSLMAFMASQRTQEIGVRMALGASWWQVVRLTTAQALKIAIGGSAVGAALAYGVGQAIQSVLQGMVANRPVSLILLMLVLTAVTLAAAFLPARRAANLDPSSALRSE